jgi:hypothetical protein
LTVCTLPWCNGRSREPRYEQISRERGFEMKKLTMLFALVIGIAMIAGCPEEETEAEGTEGTTAEPTAGETPAAEDEAEPAEADEGGGGSACDRIEQCCQDYVAALPGGGVTAEQACAGVEGTRAGGDAACQTAISAWRQSLEAASIDVPASCN